MIDTQKNEKGFTLIEMLISMAIGTVLLATAIFTYTKQDSLLRDENSNVQLRDFARLAMDALVPNLRLAGYGFPPGDSTLATPRLAQGVDVADATTLTYKANTDDLSTNVNAIGVATTDNWLWVTDPVAAGFAVDDNVVFFNASNPSDGNNYPIVGLNGTTLVWTGGNQNGFIAQAPVMVNKYHTITYTYNVGTQIITVTDDNGTDDGGGDDTTITLANNVSDLTFSYFDTDGNALTTLPLGVTDLGNLRRIQISLTVVDPKESSMTVTLSTNIHLRNMGI